MSGFPFKNTLVLLISITVLLSGCGQPGIYHTVKPGQTLYRIAKVYKIEETKLARVNHISDPTQLRANQKIFIPGATQLRSVPATATSFVQKSTGGASKKVAPKRSTVKKSTAQKSASNSKPVKGLFVWPAKGKLLNKFGKKDKNVYKGIEIGLSKGTAVIAAASGKVIYSGNAIPGYGNLVILEHSDSFFSVYGYNQKVLVKMDDHVGQGEKIALSGVPPNGQSARLHFEIRKGKSAVNPILYLP